MRRACASGWMIWKGGGGIVLRNPSGRPEAGPGAQGTSWAAPHPCPPQEKPLYEPEIGIASAGGSFVA